MATALAAGVLIDVDHALDFYNWYVRRDDRRLLVLLHAWEYSLAGVIALLAGLTDPLLVGAVLGHAGHLVTDQIANPVHPLGYSLLFRLKHRFRRHRLVYQRLEPLEEVLNANLPLSGLLGRAVARAVQRLRESRG